MKLVFIRGGFKYHTTNQHFYAVTGAAPTKYQKTSISIAFMVDNTVGSSTPTLSPSNGLYTATAGDSHTANVSVPSGWTQIYWYLKSPSESGYGTSQSSVSDSTGNATSASYTYSFPSGTSGDYVLTAYVYGSDGTIVEPSYTVSVSLPSSSTGTTTTETPAAPSAPTTPSGTLGAWSGYSLITSSPHSPPMLELRTTVSFTSVSWYVLSPGNASESWIRTDTFSPAVSDTTHYPYLGGGRGDYNVRAEITPSTGSTFSVSCTITVSSDQ